MKVLNVNKFYYLRGGAERYFFSLADLLTSHGHEVIPFAMRHPENLPSPYEKYFPSYVEFGQRGVTRSGDPARAPAGRRPMRSERGAKRQDPEPWLPNTVRAVGRMFWSLEAARKFDQLLTDTKPDLIHIHNIYHHLSPSILPVAKRHGIPVVMTVHDYKLVWPHHLLCGWSEGASPWNVVRERCTQGSYLKSALTVFETYFHDWLGVYKNNIDLFLAPSEFVREKLIVGGYDSRKIRVLPHFINVSAVRGQRSGVSGHGSILFFGRLSKEKGVDILLRMMHTLKPDVELRIAGEGPERERLGITVQRLGLRSVTFLGRLDTTTLQHEIDRALFIVVPSVAPETFGYAILESFARGKTIIASRIGAFPELVRDGKDGFLVAPGDAEDLGKKVAYLLAHEKERRAMEKQARAIVKQYTPEHHYAQLLRAYHEIL